VLAGLDPQKEGAEDAAASGSGGHLADEAAVAADSGLGIENAGGDPGLHSDPPQVVPTTTSNAVIGPETSKGKGSKRGRKRKTPDSQPDPEPANQGDHTNTSTSVKRPKKKPRP